MYATLSETSSSPNPPIVPVPSSPEPKEVGANSTGKELPSVWWTAVVLCVCVRVHTYVCWWVYMVFHMYREVVERSTVRSGGSEVGRALLG